MIVSNIGITPGFLCDLHAELGAAHGFRSGQPEGGSQGRQLRIHEPGAHRLAHRTCRELSAYFQSGGLVDSVLNLGLPAPIDVQVSGINLRADYRGRQSELPARSAHLPGVSDVLIPQDMDYPALQLNIDRESASLVGLSQKEVVDNVITALTSNEMIAPSYWVDPKSGNDYLLTVQYPEIQVQYAQRSEADSDPGGSQ